jgi:hypothetical protein
METKVVRIENLLEMFADLEAALYREVEAHGDNADDELARAVAYWADQLAFAGLLGQEEWRITMRLLGRAGYSMAFAKLEVSY